MTRVLVVGDIGQPVYHVGDEAMTISTAEYLADAGMQVILATRDTDQSRRYLGVGGSSAYEYMPFLLFPWAPAEREITLERLEEFFARRHSISAILQRVFNRWMRSSSPAAAT